MTASGVSKTRNVLSRTLRTTEYFTLAFGTMVGVGWLIVIDDWLRRGGPGGAMLGFLTGGLALVPIAYVYGKFVQAMPDAASELAYASSAFTSEVGYWAGWMMTLAYLIVCPWEAVAIGKIVSYLLPALRTGEIYRIGGIPVFAPTLALGLATTALVVILNYRGVRISARFQNLTTFGLLALFAVFTLTGLTRDRISNLKPWFSSGPDAGWLGGLVSIVMVLQIVPFFLTGFESVSKCSEEAQVGYNPRGFMRAIFLGLGVGMAFYVIIIGVVAGLVPWQGLAAERYATAVAFKEAFASDFLVRLIILAALFALLKVFNANFLTASRLIFALGRRAMIPAGMGKIHPRFQTPHQAVLFCAVLTVGGALLGEAILIPVTEVGSLCSVAGWLISCAAFVRWRGMQPGNGSMHREIAIAGIGALVATALLLLKIIPTVPGSFGLWEYVSLGAWILLGVLLRMNGDGQP